MRKSAILVDIDGTLANCDHRRKAATTQDGKMNWKEFFKNMEHDSVNEWCRDIIERYDCVSNLDPFHIILLSGRSENFKEVTQSWLTKNTIHYDLLLMRKENDFRPDTVVKKEIYETHIKDKYDVLFCIDDRKSVVDMWREQGLVCLQCAEGNF